MDTLSQIVVELCEAVWTQTLELPLVHTEAPGIGTGEVIQGQVDITGTWTGVVVLQCSPAFASDAARRIFGPGDEEVSREDIRDTIGELTNIIGGNLKAVLSHGGCRLSFPTVVERQDFTLAVPGTRVVARDAFTCERAPIVVTVLETVPIAAGSAGR